jgi:F-type H+-transporting ATPase subunit c
LDIMDAEAAKNVGAGLATLGMIGAGIGVGNIFGNFLNGALRNPSAAASQIGNLFVGAALAEALGILAFVLGILLKFG